MIFAEGVLNPEGPVSLQGGGLLIVEGAASRGCITRLDGAGRIASVVARTGRPNGLALDREGNIWAAESKTPALLRVRPAGEVETIATEFGGEPFLFPNDLCFGPDGAIYMTDSGVNISEFAPNNQIRPDYESIWYDGRVFRIDPKSGRVDLLDRGIRFANGIAFGPDQRMYVSETVTGHVFQYEGGKRRVFCDVVAPDAAPGWKGPDGLAFDANGVLYAAVFGQGDVTAVRLDGGISHRIPTQGKLPTNVAFDVSQKRIYVTEYEFGRVEMFGIGASGVRLFDGAH